jgi:hypothetical protein
MPRDGAIIFSDLSAGSMCGLLRHGGYRDERTVTTVKFSSGGLALLVEFL